jgi:hypothetical protein
MPDKMELQSEHGESDLHNEIYDDSVSDDWDYFIDRDVLQIWRQFWSDGELRYRYYGPHCGHSRRAAVRIRLKAILAICAQRQSERERDFNKL